MRNEIDQQVVQKDINPIRRKVEGTVHRWKSKRNGSTLLAEIVSDAYKDLEDPLELAPQEELELRFPLLETVWQYHKTLQKRRNARMRRWMIGGAAAFAAGILIFSCADGEVKSSPQSSPSTPVIHGPITQSDFPSGSAIPNALPQHK